MDRLRIFRKEGQINKCDWYFTDSKGVDCPVTIHLEFNGWKPIFEHNEDNFQFQMDSFGGRYVINVGINFHSADNKQARLWCIETIDRVEVNEFFIHRGHPIAHVFQKTCTFDDGVERLVPISRTKPTQPY